MFWSHISGTNRAGEGLDTYSAQLLIAEVLSCRAQVEDIRLASREIRHKAKTLERQLKNVINVLGRV